jgi:hypothetical protein
MPTDSKDYQIITYVPSAGLTVLSGVLYGQGLTETHGLQPYPIADQFLGPTGVRSGGKQTLVQCPMEASQLAYSGSLSGSYSANAVVPEPGGLLTLGVLAGALMQRRST